MTTDSLHPRVAEIIDALETAQQDFLALLESIPEARRDDMATVAGRWSIADHVEHLARVEDGTGRLISKLIKQIQSAGARETDDSSVLHSLDRYQIWTVRRPVEAPEAVRPQEGLPTSEGLARLTASRARVIAALRAASGLALSTASAPHPYFGPLDVYQWGIMIAHHQRRHAELIRGLAGVGEGA